ncbi:MAG: HDOD domain-containing protein [Opitutaceae bacterium]
MNALLLCWRDWWARFFDRPPEVAVPIPRVELAPPLAVSAVAQVADAEVTTLVGVERVTTEAEAAQSFLETVQLGSMEAAKVAPRVTDPSARERTLAGLGKLEQIPALQSLAHGFMRALDRPDVAVDEVVATIEKDSALCVRVLRMANSVLVSSERRIEDLETGVQMLGVTRVRKAAQALFTLRDANRVAEGFDWRHLWIHALATAAIAEELEQQLRSADNSQIYLAALLHDVGKIVLSTLSPDDYREILVATWNDNGRLEDLERARLGVDHREAGVRFARHNGLPAIVVEAIAHHDRPEQAEKHRFEVALISLANYLSKAYGLGFSGARLDASDGEFETLSAWNVVEEELGGRPNVERIATEMGAFVVNLRTELKGLREGI